MRSPWTFKQLSTAGPVDLTLCDLRDLGDLCVYLFVVTPRVMIRLTRFDTALGIQTVEQAVAMRFYPELGSSVTDHSGRKIKHGREIKSRRRPVP